MLRLLGQLVREMWFARSALNTALLDKTVALQRKQVCSYGIVCQVEILGQLIDRFPGAPQQGNKAPSRTAEKSLV